MRIEIATLFPDMCLSVLKESILGRADKSGAISLSCRNIRDYAPNKHNRVDDYAYGGGKGMLMQAEPIYQCYKAFCDENNAVPHVIYMSPQGRTLTQKRALELSSLDSIFIICGHYEGVDERLIEEIVDEEISIGDYVLTGGELPALVLTDCICRMCRGVLADDICFTEESHFDGLLEYPQYTRPEEWHGKKVPEVLLSGNHQNVDKWRREQQILRTGRKRPDMLEGDERLDE